MRQCEVYLHGIKTGVLTETDSGGFCFAYDKDYAIHKENPPVSLTLPLSEEVYESPYLFSCFYNMLSEGENRRVQSHLLRIDEKDDFGILLSTAQEDTIGAVTVKPIVS